MTRSRLRPLIAALVSTAVIASGLTAQASTPAPELTTSTTAMPTNASVGAAATAPNGTLADTGALGSLRAGSTSGAAASDVALDIPSYHGLEPHLALDYSSGAGDGWLGPGWSLGGLHYITRISAGRGLAGFLSSDRFQLDGTDLTACGGVQDTGHSPGCREGAASAGSTGCPMDAAMDHWAYYTTRDESDQLICRAWSAADPSRDEWSLTSPGGIRTTLSPGVTTSAGVLRFDETLVEDLQGNTVTVHWQAGDGQIPEPAEIDYPDVRIGFTARSVTDAVAVAVPGETRYISTRLAAVSVQAGGAMARAYEITYRQSQDTGRPVVSSIQQFGRGAVVASDGQVSGPSLPAQTFDTASATPAGRWTGPTTIPLAVPATGDRGSTGDFTTAIQQNPTSYRTGIFLDSGVTGMVVRRDNPADCGTSVPVTLYRTVGGPPVNVNLALPQGYCPAPASADSGATFGPWWVADLNGDGIDDVVLQLFSSEDTRLAVYLADPSEGFSPLPVLDPAAMTAVSSCAPGDLDGDGRAEMVCDYADSDGTEKFQVLDVTPDGQGSASSRPAPVTVPILYRLLFGFSQQIMIGDVNGDGRADLVEPITGGNTYISEGTQWDSTEPLYTGFQTFLSQPDGSFAAPVTTFFDGATPGDWKQPILGMQLADLNGDGNLDVVATAIRHLTAVIVSGISTGTGHWTWEANAVPGWLKSGIADVGSIPQLMDVAGDGVDSPTFVIRRAAHSAASACAPAIPYDHLEVLRARSLGNGSFAWPASVDDCADDQELDVDLSTSFWEDIGSWFSNAWASVIGEVSADPQQSSAIPGDADGDGRADVILLTRRIAAETPHIVVGYAPQSGPTPRGWLTGSVDGAGQPSFVQVTPELAVDQVHIIQPRTTPLPATCRTLHPPNPSVCRPYVATVQNVTMPQDPIPLPIVGIHLPISTGTLAGWHLLDLTGQGRDSLVYVDDTRLGPVPGRPGLTPAIMVIVVSTIGVGTAHTATVTWLPRDATSTFSSWQPADVDGTGALGLISTETTAKQIVVHQLTFTSGKSVSDRTSSVTRPPGANLSWQTADVNGDHRADLINVHPGPNGERIDTLLNTGAGLSPSGSYDTGITDPDRADWLYGDYNGDGLGDLAHLSGGTTTVVTLVEGLGPGQWRTTAAIPADFDSSGPGRWAGADLNGDGRTDLLRLSPQAIPATTSTTTVTPLINQPGPGDGTWAAQAPDVLTENATGAFGWSGVDANGDGVADLSQLVPAASGYTLDERLTQAPADRLTQISDGIGATAQLTYASSAIWRSPVSGANACSQLPTGSGGMLVSQLSVDTVDGGSSTDTYTYDCATWSTELHQALGWAQVQTTHAASADQPGYVKASTASLTPACGAQPTATSLIGANGVILQSQSETYDHSGGPGQPQTCALIQTKAQDCGDSGCPSTSLTTQTDLSYDGDGNVETSTRSQFQGEELAARRTTVYRHLHQDQPYLINTLAETSVHDGDENGPVVADTTSCYDISCDPTAPRPHGLLTSTSITDPGGNQPARTTQYTYDDYGNLTSTTDAAGHTTTTTWDSGTHLFPVAATDALGETTLTTWDPVLGLPLVTTGPDGLQTARTYDAFGRLAATSAPTGTHTSIAYLDYGTPGKQSVRTTVDDGSTDGLWQQQYFDGLGRITLQTRKSADPGDPEQTRTTYFDAAIFPATQSHWALTSAATPVLVENYRYDARGRTVLQRHPDGTQITTTYTATGNGTSVTTTDEAGHVTTRTYDGWHRETSVQQTLDGHPATVSYRYDALDHRTATTGAGGRTTTMAFDGFGDLTSQDSPDSGLTTFTYDVLGNLLSSTDARGERTRYRYDALSRITSRTSQDGTTRWSYGTGHGPAVGRLTSIIDTVSAHGCPDSRSQALTYDSRGRLTRASLCIAGRTETYAAGYDQDGRQTSITYPTGERLALSYDAACAELHRQLRPGGRLRPVRPARAVDPGQRHTGNLDLRRTAGLANSRTRSAPLSLPTPPTSRSTTPLTARSLRRVTAPLEAQAVTTTTAARRSSALRGRIPTPPTTTPTVTSPPAQVPAFTHTPGPAEEPPVRTPSSRRTPSRASALPAILSRLPTATTPLAIAPPCMRLPPLRSPPGTASESPAQSGRRRAAGGPASRRPGPA